MKTKYDTTITVDYLRKVYSSVELVKMLKKVKHNKRAYSIVRQAVMES